LNIFIRRLVNSLRSFSDLGGKIVRNKVVFTIVDTSGVMTKKNATNQCKFRFIPNRKILRFLVLIMLVI
jgi:hypothetical protein